MTDISGPGMSVPSRLGVAARLEDGELILELRPQEETLHHGSSEPVSSRSSSTWWRGSPWIRTPTVWTLTSDMSVRMRPMPAPGRIDATSTILRQGRRSATCLVELTTDRERRSPPGPSASPRFPARRQIHRSRMCPSGRPRRSSGIPQRSTQPLREEAGIQVIDAAEGVVQVEVTPDLRNPAGTLQGAMVALLAEAAAEDLMATRFGTPVVVTDLDLRYLRKTQAGPVRTRSRLLGTGPEAPVQIELIDTSTDEITTLVYANAVMVP